LSNKNESDTVAKKPKFCQLNKAFVRCRQDLIPQAVKPGRALLVCCSRTFHVQPAAFRRGQEERFGLTAAGQRPALAEALPEHPCEHLTSRIYE